MRAAAASVVSPTAPLLITPFLPKQIPFKEKPHCFSSYPNRCSLRFSCSSHNSEVAAHKKSLSGVPESEPQIQEDSYISCEGSGDNAKNDSHNEGLDLGWLPAFPHVFTASMANFLFGYHIGVMNGPIVSIAQELGFGGNSILEGLVVSIFIAGAFIGSIRSGWLVDSFGCQRTLQIDTVPLIIGAFVSAQAHSLDEILWGQFLVGLGIGLNTVLVPIYISEQASNIPIPILIMYDPMEDP